MAYPTLNATLDALAAVLGTPADGEPANVLGAVDRQTRQFIYDLLVQIMDPTTSKVKIDAGAITAALIAAKAITNAHVSDSAAIAESKVALAYTTSSLKALFNNYVLMAAAGTSGHQLSTTNKLVDSDDTRMTDARPPTTNSIDNSMVKADAGIAVSKLAAAANAARILVSAATTKVWTEVALSGDASLSSTGVLTLATRDVIVIEEQQNNGVAAGDSVTPSQYRSNFVIASAPVGSTASVGGASNTQITLPAGYYLIDVTVPGYAVGNHVAVLERYNSGNTLYTTALEPYIGVGSVAAAGSQTVSVIRAYVLVLGTDYLKVNHYTATGSVTNGLGVPMNVGLAKEHYTTVVAQRIKS